MIVGTQDWLLIPQNSNELTCVLTVFMFCWLYFMPESPVFLVAKGRTIEAERSLRRLRATKQEATAELHRLETLKASNDDADGVGLAELLTDFRFRKPFSLALALMFLQQVPILRISISAGKFWDKFYP
jgi:SP family galactose:H+ symporter-like MFS transporter